MSSKIRKQKIVAKLIIKCPTCGAPADLEARPFCSQRCADVDLGHWLQEKFSIPAVDAADDTIVESLMEGRTSILQEEHNN